VFVCVCGCECVLRAFMSVSMRNAQDPSTPMYQRPIQAPVRVYVYVCACVCACICMCVCVCVYLQVYVRIIQEHPSPPTY